MSTTRSHNTVNLCDLYVHKTQVDNKDHYYLSEYKNGSDKAFKFWLPQNKRGEEKCYLYVREETYVKKEFFEGKLKDQNKKFEEKAEEMTKRALKAASKRVEDKLEAQQSTINSQSLGLWTGIPVAVGTGVGSVYAAPLLLKNLKDFVLRWIN